MVVLRKPAENLDRPVRMPGSVEKHELRAKVWLDVFCVIEPEAASFT